MFNKKQRIKSSLQNALKDNVGADITSTRVIPKIACLKWGKNNDITFLVAPNDKRKF